jgi:hypothetical protein
MSKMAEARRNEIAYRALKRHLLSEGFQISDNTRRQIGNTADEIGIPREEANEFVEILLADLVQEACKPKVQVLRTRRPGPQD